MNLDYKMQQFLRLKFLNFALRRNGAYATIMVNGKYRGCLVLYPHIWGYVVLDQITSPGLLVV